MSHSDTDAISEFDDAELERFEADLATIEAAMDRVDVGDLEGAVAQMNRLDDTTPFAPAKAEPNRETEGT